MTPDGRPNPRLWAVLVVALALWGTATVAGVAVAEDTTAPEWGNGSRIDATTVEITLYDNEGVDESTIEAADFATPGNITDLGFESFDASDGRAGLRVFLEFESSFDRQTVNVTLSDSGTITDAAGNELPGNETVSVSGMDSQPPSMSATKVNATAINVTVRDNGTVDVGSVDGSDFAVSDGDLRNVSVRAVNGTGDRVVRATLVFESRFNVDNVTIGFQSGAGIADESGNTRTSGTVTVTGMDTVTPRFREFAVTRANASTVDIRVRTHEPLSALQVDVSGPVVETLRMANFSRVEGTTGTYTARYTFTQEGEYALFLLSVTDESNNTVSLGRKETITYDASPPNVTVTGPEEATVGEAVNFSAVTSDEQGVASVRWRVDGGTIIPGESIRVAFATPGTHRVTVIATDQLGNTARETRTVAVQGTGGVRRVNVTRLDRNRARATVRGTGRIQRVGTGPPLAGTANASLDRLSAVFPNGTTVPMSVRATDRLPPSFRTATGHDAVALFEIDHDGVSADSASLTVSVDRSRLERAGVAPSAVTVYRDEDGWVPLETTVVARNDSRVTYQASAPGLSRFVVGLGGQSGGEPATATPTATPTPTPTPETATESTATPTGKPDVRVRNVTTEPANLSVGAEAVVTVTLTNRGTATGDHNVVIRLNGSVLATRTVTVPAGERRSATFVREVPDAGPLTVEGTRTANVTDGGGAGSGIGLPSLPSPLALWPSGLVGTVLAALIGLAVTVYGLLKALAIYLGY